MHKRVMCAAVAACSTVVLAQPVQWRVEDGGNGHWYEGVLNPAGVVLPWQSARVAAVGRGADLVSITNTAEASWVYANVASDLRLWNEDFGPYVGLYQVTGASEPGGGWEWTDGTPNGGFVPWYWNQPDNYAAGCGGDQVAAYWDGGPWFSPPRDALGDVAVLGYCCCAGSQRIPSFIIEWSSDCNNDGIVDKGQILSGELPDANNNGIPDGPGIAVQPTDQTVGVNTPVTFIVEVNAPSNCSTPFTYQWQRRNPIIANPNDPGAWIDLTDGGGFLNTTSAALAIARPTPAIATGYRCKIGGGCGCEPNSDAVVYSNVVNFSVTCPSDFNADGSVDGDDVIQFFANWDGGC